MSRLIALIVFGHPLIILAFTDMWPVLLGVPAITVIAAIVLKKLHDADGLSIKLWENEQKNRDHEARRLALR